jgi:hypothetical protein
MKMLRDNFVIEEFGFVSANRGVAPKGVWPYASGAIREMTLYLRLNKAGRRRLLQDDNSTPREWVNTMISLKDDLNCIYYLLSRKPTLLNRILEKQELERGTKGHTKKRCHFERAEHSCDQVEHPPKRKRLYRASKYKGCTYR